MSEIHHSVATPFQGIILTAAAKLHIIGWLSKEKGSRGVRFSVKKTGCSGWSYEVESVLTPEENDFVLPLQNDYQVYLDKKSYPYLKGMEVDYVKMGLSSRFVFNNPNQKGQCGCGESFTI